MARRISQNILFESLVRSRSRAHFRQDVHTPNLRRDPEFRAIFFDSHYGRLATHPALFAGGEFRWKNQHQFDVAALLDARLGVEKNSVGADVTGLSRVISPFLRADSGWNARCETGTGAAFEVRSHQSDVPIGQKCPPNVHQTVGMCEEFAGWVVAVWLAREAGAAGDPSLRLKNGYAQDDTAH